MEVLSSEIIYKMHPICETSIAVGAGTLLFGLFFFIIFVPWFAVDYDWPLIVSLTLMILGAIIASVSLIIGEYCWQVEDYTKQEVIFKEDIPIEFFNDYEILEQRGEIFVIKEKEN